MKKLIKNNSRGLTDAGWLYSRHTFSFGGYFDRDNISFGPLRVINDDIIEPLSGFPTHPHKDMEIITIVLSGQLTHKDSTGMEETISYGEVQKMSAGSGILHSEYNNSPDKPVHLLQIWIIPDKAGITPGYTMTRFSEEQISDKLFNAASNNATAAVHIQQDASLYIAKYSAGQKLNYKIETGRGLFLHLVSGKIETGSETLTEGDALQLSTGGPAEFTFAEDSFFILFDLTMKM